MRKVCLFVALILLLTVFSSAFAQPQASAVIETPLAQTLPQGLDAYIQNEFTKSHLPGMSLAIVNADAVLFQGSYGEATSGQQPFILGSLSKSFTALAIMQLEEKGLLSLTDRVAQYLPEFDQTRQTTIRQLLTQTSGLKTSATMENYKAYDTPMPFIYSNQNYNLLGRIVEAVSGESFAEYVQAHIFDPLGMAHSHVDYKSAQADGLIPGSRNYFGLYTHAQMPYPTDMRSGWMTLPAAYIISCAADMGKYLQWYLGDAHPEVLSVQNRARLYSEGERVNNYCQYGYGWFVEAMGSTKLVKHDGVVENYTAFMLLLPEQGTGIVALTNSCDFLVADDYTTSIPMNAAKKILGYPTNDIGESEYWQRHLLDDLLMLALLAACLLPVLLFKRWRGRAHKVPLSAIHIFAVHLALPTLLLTFFSFYLDRPLYVVARFAPDVCIVLCVCAVCLYVIGALKIVHLLRQSKAQPTAKNEGQPSTCE